MCIVVVADFDFSCYQIDLFYYIFAQNEAIQEK